MKLLEKENRLVEIVNMKGKQLKMEILIMVIVMDQTIWIDVVQPKICVNVI